MREQLNCPNCGAPIIGLKCDFCGTQFFDIADIELNKAGYLRMKLDDSVNIFKAYPANVNIEIEPESATYYYDNEPIQIMRRPEMTVTIELRVLRDENGIYWTRKKV